MIKSLMSILILTLCLSHCTEFAMLTSGTGIAVSNNVYARAYSGIDFLTIMSTEKDIKTHVYNRLTESTPRNPPSGSGSGSSPEKDHNETIRHDDD